MPLRTARHHRAPVSTLVHVRRLRPAAPVATERERLSHLSQPLRESPRNQSRRITNLKCKSLINRYSHSRSVRRARRGLKPGGVIDRIESNRSPRPRRPSSTTYTHALTSHDDDDCPNQRRDFRQVHLRRRCAHPKVARDQGTRDAIVVSRGIRSAKIRSLCGG